MMKLEMFQSSIDLKALEIITKSLDCRVEDLTCMTSLNKGMTNHSLMLQVICGENAGRYIMRIPGEGSDQLINRAEEALVFETIRGCSFCDDPIYIDPSNGYKITRYISNARCCDPTDEKDLLICMRKLRHFHNYRVNGRPLVVPHCFDLYERIDFYENLRCGQPSEYHDYSETKRNCWRLRPFIEKNRGELQLTHNDAVPDNFLFDPQATGELAVQLIDWEYAGMQDKHVDIAMFCVYCKYNKTQVDHLIDLYFEQDNGCDLITRAKIYAYISVCGLIWSNWCEFKKTFGVEYGEYSLYQYRYAKEYFHYAVELMEGLGETI